MDITSVAIALIAGAILDRLFGDPSWLPHPVVGFGKMISFFEHRLNKDSNKVQKGAFTSIFLTLMTFIISSFLVIGSFYISYWLGTAVMSVAVFFCLAGKTLEDEVANVFRAADRSLEDGRKQVSRIVGRDTSELTDNEVRTASLETLAENLSDGVIAPLFWYLIIGVPGMLTYKMINTLDSMIGYKNERYLDFGRIAAKTDDLANYIPARITALIMIIVSGRPSLIKFVKKYGPMHASPNSGYPESALAGILNCRFGGPHKYFGETVYKPFIGSNERDYNSNDIKKSLSISRRTELLMILIILAFYASLIIQYFGKFLPIN